ncbi:CBS domain-containing protein [Streptomyces sp. NRRL WC-3549]|uniref:CBS domain-containing protein n=1 Tax=Streptomyces sp. NRRL WC-3549 TaxID=1463925 RepID=UPI000B29C880|nr:CBS domain-containing protein [Streptomyces sp. NRRL WC-3549]
MTLVQTQSRPASRRSVDTAVPEVWDDMTVEVALSVMAGARAGHLLVCDGDGQCTGRVTWGQLSAVRAGSAYTDRVRLRDITGGPVPGTTVAGAGGQERRAPAAAAQPGHGQNRPVTAQLGHGSYRPATTG